MANTASTLERVPAMERARKRAVPLEGWRGALGTGEWSRTSVGRSRPDGDGVCTEQSAANLPAGGCKRGWTVPFRRPRTELETGFERPAHLATRLVFRRSKC